MEGARRVIEESKCTDALIFWCEEYGERTAESRNAFHDEFLRLNPTFEMVR